MSDPYSDPYYNATLPPSRYPNETSAAAAAAAGYSNGYHEDPRRGGGGGGGGGGDFGGPGPGPDRNAPRRGGFRNRGGDRPPRDAHRRESGGRYDPMAGSAGGGGPNGYGRANIDNGWSGAGGPSDSYGPPSGGYNDRRPPPAKQERIDERSAKERPCRTLFVRNINYGADADDLKSRFASFGDVKTMYDVISNRGMLFVTYFDLQAAERAKDAMHGFRVKEREIDVHYSLPKDSEMNAACDRDKNQGTLMLRLRSGRTILSDIVRQTFSEFGAIKAIRNAASTDRKIIEFFDSRGAALAYDEMRERPFQDSTLDIQFLWDEPPSNKGGAAGGVGGGRDRERGRGRGGRRGDRDFQEPAGAGGRYGDDRRSALSPERTYRGGPQAGGYGPGAAGTSSAGAFSFDEARKVQDLLASLSGGGGVGAATSSVPPSAPYNPPGPPPSSYRPPQANAPAMYPPPPSNYPPGGALQPQGAYNPNFQPPPGRYPPAPGPAAPMPYAPTPNSSASGSSILPPNVVAMLQGQGAASTSAPPPAQNAGYGSYSAPSQAYAPSSMPYIPSSAPPPPSQGQAQQTQSQGNDQTQAMTQLLALLVNQQQKNGP